MHIGSISTKYFQCAVLACRDWLCGLARECSRYLASRDFSLKSQNVPMGPKVLIVTVYHRFKMSVTGIVFFMALNECFL